MRQNFHKVGTMAKVKKNEIGRLRKKIARELIPLEKTTRRLDDPPTRYFLSSCLNLSGAGHSKDTSAN